MATDQLINKAQGDAIISGLTAIKNAINDQPVPTQVEDVVADAFDVGVSYVPGDYCINENKLYVCDVAHHGAWDGNDFTLTTVGAVLESLNNDLSLRGMTQLAITANTTDTQFTIDNINNYDIIVLQLTRTGSDSERTFGCSMLPVSSFKNTASNKLMNTVQLTTSTNTTAVGSAYYVDDTHVKMRNSEGWGTVLYGIKL